MPGMPGASVVIVNYRTVELTLSATVSALTAGADEVIVVDNASGDDVDAAVSAISDNRARVIVNDANVGFGSAANRGASVATGDVLIFLNSDAQLNASALEALRAELQRWNGSALVGPRLIDPIERVQRSVGLLPEPFDLAVRALGLHRVASWVGNVPLFARLVRRTRVANEYAAAVTASEPMNTTMVSGACFAIGRDVFGRIAGFDQRFFMYFEDADLCRRVAAAGMPIRYVPSAVVRHVGGASSSEDYHFGALHARSMRQYLAKWYGMRGSVLAIVLLWLRAIGFSLALQPGAGRAWRALGTAIRDEDPRR